jgi:hypothetical protein
MLNSFIYHDIILINALFTGCLKIRKLHKVITLAGNLISRALDEKNMTSRVDTTVSGSQHTGVSTARV